MPLPEGWDENSEDDYEVVSANLPFTYSEGQTLTYTEEDEETNLYLPRQQLPNPVPDSPPVVRSPTPQLNSPDSPITIKHDQGLQRPAPASPESPPVRPTPDSPDSPIRIIRRRARPKPPLADSPDSPPVGRPIRRRRRRPLSDNSDEVYFELIFKLK